MKISGREVGRHCPPLVIAEMSGNHNQSLERALAIVDSAADSGAHALKIQTFTPDTMTLDLDEGEFHISDPRSPWVGATLYDLYRAAQTPWAWHRPIFERARERGMIAFSTPFDETAIDFLEDLGAPCYKIASFENVDLALVRKAAVTGKPLIISSGMASLAELDDVVRAAREAGCTQLALLKCTSTYPADPSNSNVATIPHMRELFGCEIGVSDHTLGIGVSVASVALGASIIEKHFTIRRADGGVDAAFSMEPSEMSQLVVETERAWRGLGRVTYGPVDAEGGSTVFRRSLYFVKDVSAGQVVTRENVRAIRPGFGLPPKYHGVVMGMRVRTDVRRGTPVRWELLG